MVRTLAVCYNSSRHQSEAREHFKLSVKHSPTNKNEFERVLDGTISDIQKVGVVGAEAPERCQWQEAIEVFEFAIAFVS